MKPVIDDRASEIVEACFLFYHEPTGISHHVMVVIYPSL